MLLTWSVSPYTSHHTLFLVFPKLSSPTTVIIKNPNFHYDYFSPNLCSCYPLWYYYSPIMLLHSLFTLSLFYRTTSTYILESSSSITSSMKLSLTFPSAPRASCAYFWHSKQPNTIHWVLGYSCICVCNHHHHQL